MIYLIRCSRTNKRKVKIYIEFIHFPHTNTKEEKCEDYELYPITMVRGQDGEWSGNHLVEWKLEDMNVSQSREEVIQVGNNFHCTRQGTWFQLAEITSGQH